jgi:ketosteroid isomerase-like protein
MKNDAHASDIALLEDLNRNYVRAALESDAKWYQDNLADDYTSSNPDGSFVDKAGFIKRISRPYPGSEARAEHVTIRVLGDFALIHSGFRHRRADGREQTGRYTDTWARRNGRWLCIAAQFHLLSTDDEMLRDLNRHYIRAVSESDVKWFEENLAADFLVTNPDCSLLDKAGFLKQVAPPCAVTNLQCEDVRVRITGDTAIIHARTTYGKPDGKPGSGRYTDIWARRNGRWLCIAAQVGRG